MRQMLPPTTGKINKNQATDTMHQSILTGNTTTLNQLLTFYPNPRHL